MKIIFDDSDKRIEEMERNGDLPIHLIGKKSEKCSLELKINDPYKCSIFLSNLFYDLKDFTKEECGFEVTAVSLLGVYSDFKDVKEDVLDAVTEALEKHGIY